MCVRMVYCWSVSCAWSACRLAVCPCRGWRVARPGPTASRRSSSSARAASAPGDPGRRRKMHPNVVCQCCKCDLFSRTYEKPAMGLSVKKNWIRTHTFLTQIMLLLFLIKVFFESTRLRKVQTCQKVWNRNPHAEPYPGR